MTTVLGDVDSPPSGPGEGRGRSGLSSFGGGPSPWRGGLAAARRHTVLVRILRGGALAICLVAAGIVLTGALFPPSQLAKNALSAAKVAFDGTRITLESPKVSGYQLDRKPYSIKARLGLQDLANPQKIELLDIDAGIGSDGDKMMQVKAKRAQYDSQNEQVVLNGDVKITSTSGYDLSLQEARVDFKDGTLVSDAPVNLRLEGATVSGQRMHFDDRAHVITFEGGVKSSIHPRSERQADLAVPAVRSVR